MASSGIRSPIGGLFSGFVVVLTLGTLGSTLKYIPRSTLSAMTIAATIFMIRYDIIPHLWRTKKIDLCVMLITFFGCIGAGADYGILFGLASSVIVLLYTSARPDIVVEKTHTLDREYILVQPDRTLSFPSVEYVRHKVTKVQDGSYYLPVVFDGTHLCNMDFTVAQCLKELTDEFKKRDQLLMFTNLRKEVLDVIQGMGAPNFVYYATRAEAEFAMTGSHDEEPILEEKIDLTNVATIFQSTDKKDDTDDGGASVNAKKTYPDEFSDYLSSLDYPYPAMAIPGIERRAPRVPFQKQDSKLYLLSEKVKP